MFFPLEQDFASHTTTFDNNAAQIHDWLTLMEKKVNAAVVIGDSDDMETALQRHTVSVLIFAQTFCIEEC